MLLRNWFDFSNKSIALKSVVSSFLNPCSIALQQIRGRKRNLKAGLSKAEKAAKRQAREAKEASRKQYNFMQRNQIRRMKSLLSPSEQFPGRYSSDAEGNLPEIPATNIYIKSAVKTQFHSLSYALSLHRKLQEPSIYNNPDGLVRLRLELNMLTERANKPVNNSEEIVPVPYPFKHNEKRAILAFVQDQKLQELAVEKGAEIAVGADVVKKIVKGQFRVDDYDFCVAHSEIAGHITPLRGVLKSKCPTRLNGALGDDLGALIEKFKSGIKVSIQADPVHPEWGLSNIIIGKLSMSDEQLEENLAAIINAVCKHRNPALGSFINRAVLMVPPTTAYFAIDVQKFVPVASASDKEKVIKKRKKRKAEEEQGTEAETKSTTISSLS